MICGVVFACGNVATFPKTNPIREAIVTRSSDTVKAATWKQHFDRFHLSGLSVQRFCNLNKLSVHSFQYWAKRLEATGQRRHSTKPVLTSGSEANSKSMLTIQFGANVEIRIPTDQLDTIKSVLLCCASAQSDSGSFRSVLVRD